MEISWDIFTVISWENSHEIAMKIPWNSFGTKITPWNENAMNMAAWYSWHFNGNEKLVNTTVFSTWVYFMGFSWAPKNSWPYENPGLFPLNAKDSRPHDFIFTFHGIFSTHENQLHGIFSTHEKQLHGIFSTQENQLHGTYRTYENQLHGIFSTHENQLHGTLRTHKNL